ncbi:MAG: VWA domain-containing protein [Acidobacteria bacterium]|nr:VWA domain-containing protein [Acidobacteriota bacterium]
MARSSSGDLVTDLSATDFAVFEDGKAQQVDQFFRQGDVPPLRLALLFDASLSVRTRLDFEKRAAKRFFSQAFRAGDQAALYTVASKWTLMQPLTGSVGSLVDATDHIEAGGTTSLYGAVIAASQYLGESDGRRVLVLLTDGYDNAARETLAATLEAAQRSDIVIYGISPAGTGDSKSQVAKLGSAALNQLCEQTGGRAFFPAIEMTPEAEVQSLDRIYQRIIAELQAQYVLTYYSNDTAKDGRFRPLRVDVRRPGVTVSSRKGYYAR